MKIAYTQKRFAARTLGTIDQANEILHEYAEQGFDLTLRQLYYQFVARDLIPNTHREYKRLGSVVNDARLAGLIDWARIVDRTRNVQSQPNWDTPADIVSDAARQFMTDRWATQPVTVEVWIEKDALVGVIERPCRDLRVKYFSCRGYTSQSEMWAAGQRLCASWEAGKAPVILHLGDHDPSGVDMSRDIEDRLAFFASHHGHRPAEFFRIALTMDQIRQYGPPPNPAKMTDSRSSAYVKLYGHQSWELDALEPQVIDQLIRRPINAVINREAWDASEALEQEGRDLLSAVADSWPSVVEGVR